MPSEATTIADLPVDVLARCLGFLGLEERQRVALVCRRFAAAACSPKLLRDVILLHIDVPILRSLAAWLVRHGRHVRKLCIWDGRPLDPGDEGSIGSAVATCLTAVCAAGQLIELEAGMTLHWHTEWLAAACSLRHLSLYGLPLTVSPAIAGLTGLLCLELSSLLMFPEEFQLPCSITQVAITDGEEKAMTPQLAQLPRLQRLQLRNCWYSYDSLSRLSALAGSLTRLDLNLTACPAGGVAELTQLQHLECGVDDEADALDVAGALPHLTGLTCLAVWGTRGEVCPPATASRVFLRELSCLSQLRVWCLEGWRSMAAVGEALLPPLPGGPWLNSLRWLAASIDTLLASVMALQQATRLEHLGLWGSSVAAPAVYWYSPAAAALFEWLAHHPPLRCLSVEEDVPGYITDLQTNTFLALVSQLRHRRPALRLHCPALGCQAQTVRERLRCEHPF